MIASMPPADAMYQAVAQRDASFVGIFLVAVRSTGIFCKPGCPAKTPKRENVEFFASAKEALFAGYRPCLRCKPMESVASRPLWVTEAIQAVETAPDRRLRAAELRAKGLSPERLARWFKANYGMTFQAYSRALRLGEACRHLRGGEDVLSAAMESGFESSSGFRSAFNRLFGDSPSASREKAPLTVRWLETPIGPMLAAATDSALYLLEFIDRRMLEAQIESLRSRTKRVFVPGSNAVLEKLERELWDYFQGTRRDFETPLAVEGAPFQEKVWRRLLEIPYGSTLSYSQLASDIGSKDAQRAVGRANGENRIAILIPCHRVIKADGSLCGYGGGVWRKQRLLELESGQLPL